MRRFFLLSAVSVIAAANLQAESFLSGASNTTIMESSYSERSIEDDATEMVELVMMAMPEGDEKVRYKTLTDEDFVLVAEELGVEVAAIKAIVRIEAGAKLQGFWAPGVPVVNYTQSLFNKYNGKVKGRKIKDAKVPNGLTGYALKEWKSLTSARKINADAADMGSYWGMFQIGGYNYKLCGCKSVEEMVNKVCESEFSQLEMFAVFIRNAGMLDFLRNKDWASFARKYNGASYARRGYHTRMAREYEKFKSLEAQGQSGNVDSDTNVEVNDTLEKSTIKKTSASKKYTHKKYGRKSRKK